MNLLIDPWIPVREGAVFKQIRYKDVLCIDNPDLQIALPRDDLELACIQMLAAITQVIFMPQNKNELRERVKMPLTENEYDAGVKKYIDWFDLEHPEWPFMQVNETGAKETTPIQKLFPGLPAGNNHAFFNTNNEILKVCISCATIGLFNLCTQTPNLSGKHKGGLRGGAPVSTNIYDSKIRNVIWLNVLSKEFISEELDTEVENEPVWKKRISANSKIAAGTIGIARGLFWAPIHVKLTFIEEGDCCCDSCGIVSHKLVNAFYLGSDFKFDVIGLWQHPYSPRQLNIQKKGSDGQEKPAESTVSFRNSSPAWTQLSELLFHSEKTEKDPGYVPAAVVRQYNQIYNEKKIHLMIGGYRNKQAAILQRRHELYSMPAGWSNAFRDRIVDIVSIGIKTESVLCNKALGELAIGSLDRGIKGIGKKIKISKHARDLFYHLTEPLIHNMLRETKLREFISSKNQYIEELTAICLEIFEQVTKPYVIKPELIGSVSLARVKLKRQLTKLKEAHTTITGGAV